MKILAIEKPVEGVDWNSASEILKQEAAHVYMMQMQSVLREIYFNQDTCAVLILECKDKTEAASILSEFPLVKKKFISFEIHELLPYRGFERLLHEKIN
ncbi:MAG: hypothetical protein JXA72_04540 [Bacteroidales bacterium]|nr:hypothetical protein [Bacteroidales bacterium]